MRVQQDYAALGGVAVRAAADIQTRSVCRRDQTLGPVMIDGATGQIRDLGRRPLNRGRALVVAHPHDRVAVGDVKLVADERHAERRHQIGQKHRANFRDAVAVHIAQQHDAIRARHRAAGPLLELLEEPALDAFRSVVRPRRRVGLGDEHIAIRQHVQPAGMIQSARECDDLCSGCRDRRAARRPPFGGDDFDDGN